VEIDQPGHHEEPPRINDLRTAGAEIAANSRHFATAKGNIGYFVAAAYRIDDAATSEQEIRHGLHRVRFNLLFPRKRP
jgi:hypothetical protein